MCICFLIYGDLECYSGVGSNHMLQVQVLAYY